jgi:hypothetical protein
MIQRREAKQLSSANEWSLISSSLPPTLETLSLVRLKAKITRARKLRGKYQDLFRRQKLSSRSIMSGAPDERLNVRTRRKKQMFDEAVGRLQLQLGKVNAGAKVSSRTATPKRAKTSMRSVRSKSERRSGRNRRSLRDQAASPATYKSAKREAAGHKRRHGRAAASTRRKQSKRDSMNRH